MKFKGLLTVFLLYILITPKSAIAAEDTTSRFWQIQSIDTMVSSRDMARLKTKDLSFNDSIDKQVSQIASTGATHVAIDTPYDDEFVPYLTRWVNSARKNKLSVWFRGNWSGWEGWFDYPRITQTQHLQKTHDFIMNHPSLFSDGDIFSSCPECENGGPGDPRNTGEVIGFRKFLIDSYGICKDSFAQIKKTVNCGIQSSNGDVAKLIYDKPTALALGGIVSVDHYVRDPEKLISDLSALAKSSGAKIILGEFGAPILDIHGSMTHAQQTEWISKLLTTASLVPEIIGVNYWSNIGSSTAIWSSDVSPFPAVQTITNFYKPQQLKVNITNKIGEPISKVTVNYLGKEYPSIKPGQIALPRVASDQVISIIASGYQTQGAQVTPETDSLNIVMAKKGGDLFFWLKKLILDLSRSILS